ncbi:MAG: phosphate ABC transporter permease PstA [Planctomycetota bacterium]|nr:phosphate ABC transporter permease PstA [Planctomycetota bacterium]
MRFAPATTHRTAVTLMWALALTAIGLLLFILGFILWHGLPHVTWTFLSQSPRLMGEEGGVLPMIVGTLCVTVLALLIAAPLGVAAAIYLTEYTRESRLTSVIRFGADCLAGIPSIIFGLFGFVFFVITLGLGLCIVSGALTLTLMVLPTIIRTSEEAIRAVPRSYREVSYGLGSSRWQMVTRVVLKSAMPGIGTGIVLAMGRCIAETAATMLTVGSALQFPTSAFDSTRTLALHFYILSREGLSMANAYATASVLIVAMLAINMVSRWLMSRYTARVR